MGGPKTRSKVLADFQAKYERLQRAQESSKERQQTEKENRKRKEEEIKNLQSEIEGFEAEIATLQARIEKRKDEIAIAEVCLEEIDKVIAFWGTESLKQAAQLSLLHEMKEQYASFVLYIREGKISTPNDPNLNVEVPSDEEYSEFENKLKSVLSETSYEKLTEADKRTLCRVVIFKRRVGHVIAFFDRTRMQCAYNVIIKQPLK